MKYNSAGGHPGKYFDSAWEIEAPGNKGHGQLQTPTIGLEVFPEQGHLAFKSHQQIYHLSSAQISDKQDRFIGFLLLFNL